MSRKRLLAWKIGTIVSLGIFCWLFFIALRWALFKPYVKTTTMKVALPSPAQQEQAISVAIDKDTVYPWLRWEGEGIKGGIDLSNTDYDLSAYSVTAMNQTFAVVCYWQRQVQVYVVWFIVSAILLFLIGLCLTIIFDI